MINRLLLASMLLAPLTHARFAFPPEAPVDRLITNTSAYVKENPKDPMGYYTLARVNYLALYLASNTLRAFDRAKLPDLPQMFNDNVGKGATRVDDKKVLTAHLQAAVENYRKAIELAPDNALFHLGLGSVLNAALERFGDELPPLPGHKSDQPIKQWKPIYEQAAIDSYGKAYDLAVEKDLAAQHQPIRGLSDLVSWEAGLRLSRMMSDRGLVDEKEIKRVDEIEKTLKALKAKPRGPITPIVFALSPITGLHDLIDQSKRVSFNLDGTGRPQTQTWPKPATAILVWDPRHTGRITSGHQLFGTVTFNMFWRDGYAALDALDDNRDGTLAGAELNGLSAWRDADGNGVSDPGEVIPIQSLGVESIRVRAAGRDGNAPMNPAGVTFDNGRVLPTWDWTIDR